MLFRSVLRCYFNYGNLAKHSTIEYKAFGNANDYFGYMVLSYYSEFVNLESAGKTNYQVLVGYNLDPHKNAINDENYEYVYPMGGYLIDNSSSINVTSFKILLIKHEKGYDYQMLVISPLSESNKVNIVTLSRNISLFFRNPDFIFII